MHNKNNKASVCSWSTAAPLTMSKAVDPAKTEAQSDVVAGATDAPSNGEGASGDVCAEKDAEPGQKISQEVSLDFEDGDYIIQSGETMTDPKTVYRVTSGRVQIKRTYIFKGKPRTTESFRCTTP